MRTYTKRWGAVNVRVLAAELERSHPGVAALLHDGLEETLTVTRLGVRGRLKRTLQSTECHEGGPP